MLLKVLTNVKVGDRDNRLDKNQIRIVKQIQEKEYMNSWVILLQYRIICDKQHLLFKNVNINKEVKLLSSLELNETV